MDPTQPLLAALDLLDPQVWRWPLTLVYLALLSLVAIYGLHRYWLLHLFRRHRRDHRRPARRFADLPRVTVQLPMFNEAAVAERVIDAACRLDYPRDRLQIQVLDDSTGDAADLARRRADLWRSRGVDVEYVHRPDRTGFKAGALQAGLASATGDLIAIFDADFVPPADFLRRTVHYFTDPALGMVQARWAHLNRDESLLTRGQAIFLDGHFLIEHTARNRAGAWINFNGTAGVWRRAAIESAGGWQHDTLTEDVDLSYRAQLVGWTFLFLPWLQCPAELPPEIDAFKSQQHRWTKGSIQVALKMLPAVLRSTAPPMVKLEAFFHLTSPMVYLYVTLVALLLYPVCSVGLSGFDTAGRGFALGIAMILLGTVSAAAFYVTSQSVQRHSAWRTLAQVPLLMALGVGVALSNALACLEALVGHRSAFIRTPKYGHTQNGRTSTAPPRRPLSAAKSRMTLVPLTRLSLPRLAIIGLELAMGLYMLACARLALGSLGGLLGAPFLLLFAAGYLYVGLTGLHTHFRPRLAPAPLPTPAQPA